MCWKRKTGVRKTLALVKRLKKKEEEREIRERARRREKKNGMIAQLY